MPVAAVIPGGRLSVSSGSEITMAGSIFGWKMIFLTPADSSMIADARPTSEPVPAVVGMATQGAIAPGSARRQLLRASSKSHSGRVCPAMSAIALPVSIALPPPKAMMPSCSPSR